jgi:hypothetical protein
VKRAEGAEVLKYQGAGCQHLPLEFTSSIDGWVIDEYDHLKDKKRDSMQLKMKLEFFLRKKDKQKMLLTDPYSLLHCYMFVYCE